MDFDVLPKKMVATKPFDFPFAVADTLSGPVLQWDSYSLKLQFTDYQATSCEVMFREVSHFEMLVEDELDSKIYPYDGAVEVVNSPVIAKLIQIGDIERDDAEHFRHLVVGFNEIGAYLVIVYRTLESLTGRTRRCSQPLALGDARKLEAFQYSG